MVSVAIREPEPWFGGSQPDGSEGGCWGATEQLWNAFHNAPLLPNTHLLKIGRTSVRRVLTQKVIQSRWEQC
jgi:hypothetical protein